jgi:dihydroneopterin aldolase
MGIIQLKGMEFFAYHGFYEEEQRIGNKYSVDITVNTDFSQAAQQDDLTKTVNYEELYRITKMQMQIPSKLLEHIAQQIGEQVLAQFTNVNSITVMVKKFNPPIGGVCDYAAAECHLLKKL